MVLVSNKLMNISNTYEGEKQRQGDFSDGVEGLVVLNTLVHLVREEQLIEELLDGGVLQEALLAVYVL